MRTRTAAAAGAVLLLTLTGCSESYDDITSRCIKTLRERPEGETGKPKECEKVKEDDYTAIVGGIAIERLGWTDENGDFDENKMIEDTLNGDQ